MYSVQPGAEAGRSAIYFDSLVYGPPGYQDVPSQAVQFCLQPDNTFLVQNRQSVATDVRICAGIITLFTTANGATSGCAPITLLLA